MSQIRIFVGASLFCLVLCGAATGQTTWYIDAANTGGPWDGSAQHPFRFIQDGVDAAANGDTVLVMAGTYAGNRNRDIDFYGKAITVRSHSGAGATVVDCGGGPSQEHRGFVFGSGEGGGSVLHGFTIINGYAVVPHPTSAPPAGCGGGILCLGGSSPLITGCVIRDCRAESCGGGMHAYGSAPVVESCVFENNAALDVAYMGGFGGGLSLYYQSHGEVTDCAFRGNSAPLLGGGIAVNMVSSPAIRGCLVEGNSARSGGGIASGGSVHFENCSPVIAECTVAGNSAASLGGGISCASGDPVIRRNKVVNNEAQDGGGIYLYRGGFLADANEIRGNTAGQGGGISVSAWTDTTGTIRNCIVAGNSAYDGGGIKIWSIGSIVVNQCLVVFNTADHFGGGVSHEGDHTFVACTFYGNTAGTGGGALLAEISSAATLVNCVLWNNAPHELRAQIGGSVAAAYSCVRNGWPGPGNLSDAPLFADPANEDFHLTYDSPCRNAGIAGFPELLAEDFEGDRRVVQGAADMGADEFSHHLYYLGEAAAGGQVAVRAIGAPGMPVTLALGAGVQDPPRPTAYGKFHLVFPLTRSHLGAVPPDGVLSIPVTVPSGWAGDIWPFQALIGDPASPAARLSNLMLVAVE